MNLKRSLGYASCAFIGLVCVVDNTLNVITAPTLQDMEQNPIASAVISHHGVAGLVMLKAAGAVAAVAVSLIIIRTKYAVSVHVVAALQAALLWYLCFSGVKAVTGSDYVVPMKVVEFFTELGTEKTDFQAGRWVMLPHGEDGRVLTTRERNKINQERL